MRCVPGALPFLDWLVYMVGFWWVLWKAAGLCLRLGDWIQGRRGGQSSGQNEPTGQ